MGMASSLDNLLRKVKEVSWVRRKWRKEGQSGRRNCLLKVREV